MVDIMNDYQPVIDSVMRNGLVDKENPWTFFNAMVYSSTIYTTIGEWGSMDLSGAIFS